MFKLYRKSINNSILLMFSQYLLKILWIRVLRLRK